MKVKLIKTNEEFMLNPSMEGFKLSLKNCQAIERGYDLDELVEEWVFETNSHKWSNNDDTAGDNYGSFKAGFKKALELIGDKKYSEHQLNETIAESWNSCEDNEGETFSEIFKRIKQSLQQTEWDVEVVMEPCFYDDSLGGFSTSYKEGMPIEQPKRDGDGCLILKRI